MTSEETETYQALDENSIDLFGGKISQSINKGGIAFDGKFPGLAQEKFFGIVVFHDSHNFILQVVP
jgi:hypothetical protein